jgi:hypothetical protein
VYKCRYCKLTGEDREFPNIRDYDVHLHKSHNACVADMDVEFDETSDDMPEEGLK